MNLNEFKANFKYGGVRTSLFQVTITNPIIPNAETVMSYRAKSAQVPSSTIESLEVKYFARAIKLPGRKTYEDYTINFYEDEDLTVRNAFEAWSNAINSPETNTRLTATTDTSEYKSTILLEQLNQKGEVIRTYKLLGAYPTTVGSVELDWEQESIYMFPVTFAYDYFIIEEGSTGNAGGFI